MMQQLRNGCLVWFLWILMMLFQRRWVPFEEYMTLMGFVVVERHWYGNTYKYVGK